MSTGKLVLDELVRQMMEEKLKRVSHHEDHFIQLEIPVPELPDSFEEKRYIYDIDSAS
jgi:hypothetical protein